MNACLKALFGRLSRLPRWVHAKAFTPISFETKTQKNIGVNLLEFFNKKFHFMKIGWL